MTHAEQREYALREIEKWQRKFRVLSEWTITYDDEADYSGQCAHGTLTKTATIYKWGGEDISPDYIFHEMLHIALAAVKDETAEYHDAREREEHFVQDICGAMTFDVSNCTGSNNSHG